MRVVFDTNILVSAVVTPGGRGEAALMRIIDGWDSLVISRAIIEELLGVLARKFGRDPEQLARVAVFLAELAEVVEPDHDVDVLEDEPDNRILECAASGSAAIIVTGDRAMLDLGTYEGIDIISLHEFLIRSDA